MEGEHARIMALMEKVTHAFVRHASPSAVNAILLELSGYALVHFREEDELMRLFAFPGANAHKEEHDRLATYIRSLLDMHSKQEALQCAVSALDHWLDEHIHIVDKEFYNFLQSKM